MVAIWRICAVIVLAMPFAISAPARAEVESYLLFNMKDGEIIAQHRPTALWYPASITKLMTAYVTFDAIENGALKMTSPVQFSPQARQQPPSKMGFPKGTIITIETGLRIILTKSANDVSVALAEAVGGTQQNFIDAMNDVAKRLGMNDSHFDNPHGLPNTKQVTTARDIAVLMMALERDFPQYRDFFTMSGVQLGKRRLTNHNALIRRFRGADGMKTGFICASGFNLAATATRDGVRLGAVVLGGLTSGERNQRTAELLSKGFQALENGGIVALDGFSPDVREGFLLGPMFTPTDDDPDPLLAVADVTGERPDFGTVVDLPATRDTVAEDRLPAVCVRPRPATRYSAGLSPSRAALDAKRAAAQSWHRANREREAAKKAALAAPLSAPRRARPEPTDAETASAETPLLVAASATQPPLTRELAGEGLRPQEWTPVHHANIPAPRPVAAQTSSVSGSGSVWTRTTTSDLAPDGWAPAPIATPWRHPLAKQRQAAKEVPPRPEALPLGYLQAPRAITPVNIRLGGADEARPNPFSGPVVGGGQPPRPEAKPANTQTAKPVDPTSVLQHAADVREDALPSDS